MHDTRHITQYGFVHVCDCGAMESTYDADVLDCSFSRVMRVNTDRAQIEMYGAVAPCASPVWPEPGAVVPCSPSVGVLDRILMDHYGSKK